MKYFYFLFLSDVRDYTNLFRDDPQTHKIPNIRLQSMLAMNKLKKIHMTRKLLKIVIVIKLYNSKCGKNGCFLFVLLGGIFIL